MLHPYFLLRLQNIPQVEFLFFLNISAIIAVAPNSPVRVLWQCKYPTGNDPGNAFGIITRKCTTHSFQVFLPQRSDHRQSNCSVPGHLLQNDTSTEMTSQLPQGSFAPHENAILIPDNFQIIFLLVHMSRKYKQENLQQLAVILMAS